MMPGSQVHVEYYGASDSRTRATTSTRFSHKTKETARKPASFWRQKRDRRHFSKRFCKNVVVSKQVKNTVAVLAFFDQQKRLSYQQ